MSNDQADEKKGLSILVKQATMGDNSGINSPSKINANSNLDDIKKNSAW